MGAKIYGPTSIGPHCKIGGELGNVSFQGYSNKAHDGFLGNSVIGQWCNLGADTNCSNLKNNYSIVKQYNYKTGKEESTGLNFCGLVMGDYSKCGINTMWNTGSVVGVCVNFYGAGFPKKYLPDFYWGDALQGELYDLDKALETIAVVKSRRGLILTENEKEILTALHANTIV
jgi:UDP-N-acetylglucosamine diphosphorylase/glucosamine-1-phosphate N-acetyltransferase